jgi:tetratricopeptide (TPR) repeat protein
MQAELSGREELLDEVATNYLRAVGAGQTPDRQELLNRYPDLAAELNEFFADQDRVQELAAPLRSIAPAPGASGQTFGDFEVEEEIGRGGMGVVYKARQKSLNRTVALKVLPFASTMDVRQLQRFQNEARAAAGLHHTNIVPVYFVGCDRGVHFYAMQYIEGRNLAEVITQLRGAAGEPMEPVPSSAIDTRSIVGFSTEGAAKSREYFRAAARLGIQAAEALDHAHQLGIVHRDVKPANLLVDDAGRLWVTDFGLAQLQSDARLTVTGDLVGTLRYMSPEQALARRVVVDHRTDVYSLGATLYELLTLRPVFEGDDRQELLRQVAFEEPRRPRRVSRTIPPELETIVLKALEKEPQERYATAQKLADDLRNFLEDRAIRARRPSLVNRVGRWCRRHKALVRSAAAVLLLVVLSVGCFLGWRQWQFAALEQEVGKDLQAADLLQEQERWAEELQFLERASGRLAAEGPRGLRERVEVRRRNVAMVARLEDARLLRQLTGRGAGGFDLEGANKAYAAAFASCDLNVEGPESALAAQRIKSSPIRKHLIAALDDWAFVRKKLRAGSEAQLQGVAGLADDDPWRQQLRDPEVSNDQVALERLAGAEDVLDQPPANLVFLSRTLVAGNRQATAVRLLRRAQARHPTDFWINYQLAHELFDEPTTRAEAIGFYRVALALRPQSAFVHQRLGQALSALEQLPEAEAAFRKATELAPDYPIAFNNLGAVLLVQGKRGDAEAVYNKAIELDPGYAMAYYGLGVTLHQQKKLREAEAALRKAIELDRNFDRPYAALGDVLRAQENWRDAADVYRKATDLNPRFAKGYNYLGVALMAQNKFVDAETACRKALEIDPYDAFAYDNLGYALKAQRKLSDAVDAYNQAISLNKDFAEAYDHLGVALYGQKKWAEAEAAHNEAIKLKPDFAGAYNNLGNALQNQGKLSDAIVAYNEAVKHKENYAEAYNNLGGAYKAQNKLRKAEDAFRKAIELKPGFAVARYNLADALTRQGRFAEALVESKQAHEQGSRNPGWHDPSGQQVRDAERRVELDTKLPTFLNGQAKPAGAAECLELATICRYKQLNGGTTRFYSEAFAAEPKLAKDLNAQHRYDAACAAALAGCRQGEDADKFDEMECARLRRQAWDWLQADLKAYQQAMDKPAAKAGPLVVQRMQHWLQDIDFAGVRGADALDKLPEAEREDWQKLWQDVEALGQRAAKPPTDAKPARP